MTQLARRLGLFDATMLVMGGIIGSGIFINPSVVARQVHSPALILGAWIIGGALALMGAFIWAELATLMPEVGGQYAYLREAFHPLIGFLYGWALLLVIQTGGMAAVAITFARYFLELTNIAAPDWLIAASALAVLTLINCLGVVCGGRTQSLLMVLKILALAALIGIGFFAPVHTAIAAVPSSADTLTDFGGALVPVLFAYGGWQTANFVAAEMREPRRDLPRALLLGVIGVIALYLSVNFVCVHVLGAIGLAATSTPASAIMRLALGERGAMFIAAAIAISTLGFLSQSILTAPRVYYAMANDALFFRAVARVSARTHVPVVAIILQSVWTIVIALTGRYDQILNYVVAMDFLFFGLTACALLVLRKRSRTSSGIRLPGQPFTTLLFVAACWLVVGNTIFRYPAHTLIGMAILLAGAPVYAWWNARRRTT
ncbi:MAG: amino acid permease [Verrucomicrobiota bacterium]|nr:amino acid permease [Verrucomicrobiota bacterium]